TVRFDSHDPQECNLIRETQSEDVAGDESAARTRRWSETLASRLVARELRPGLVENLSPLGQQLGVLFCPGSEIGTTVDSRESPATNGRIQSTDLRLGDGEGNQQDWPLFRVVEITPELLDGQASRFGVLD